MLRPQTAASPPGGASRHVPFIDQTRRKVDFLLDLAWDWEYFGRCDTAHTAHVTKHTTRGGTTRSPFAQRGAGESAYLGRIRPDTRYTEHTSGLAATLGGVSAR